MAVSKPEIVLLHAGWHTPANYAEMKAELDRRDIRLHVPLLPTMNGDSPATSDLSTDTTFVKDYVTKLLDKGTEVIVLMHSWGGQVGTNALAGLGATQRQQQGKPGGILRLVYMAAYAVDEGKSMWDWMILQGHKDLIPLAFEFPDDGTVVCLHTKAMVVGDGFVSDAKADEYIGRFTTWGVKCWSDRIEQCAWREIPVTYIQTLQDKTIPMDYQKAFVEIMTDGGADISTFTIDTGHCPNFTATVELADILEKTLVQTAT